MNNESETTVQPNLEEGRESDIESFGALHDSQVGASFVRLLRQHGSNRQHQDTWQGYPLHMQGLSSGDTESFWNRPINDFVDNVPEFDSITFPIVKRIVSTTIGGGPRKEPEPTGFKLLIEIYEPEAGLVPVQPMSLPSGLLFYMDFQYSATTQENKIDELD